MTERYNGREWVSIGKEYNLESSLAIAYGTKIKEEIKGLKEEIKNMKKSKK
jgi:hypothetical protein